MKPEDVPAFPVSGDDNPNRMKPDDVLFVAKWSMEDLRKLIVARKAQNKAMIEEAQKHVGGNLDRPLLNPEYVARAEATKKLKQQLKTYSGSSGIANDLLFNIKSCCDAENLNFTKVAQEEIRRMKGLSVVGPSILKEEIKAKPKNKLASRFKHWLWKHGLLPTHFITKKELSIEEANK